MASIDSQTVEATGVADSRGHDGGKKIIGRKRHIIVDKLGLLLAVLVSVDEGTLAPEVLGRRTAEHRARPVNIWTDGKYRYHHLDGRLNESEVKYVIEVVGRPAGSMGSWSSRNAISRSGHSRGWAGVGNRAGIRSGSTRRVRRSSKCSSHRNIML